MTLPNPQILSISKLTEKIKQLLEQNYPIIWIVGEISNLKIPKSGHAYFVLKDEKAQISAIFFKGQKQQLKFNLQDGLTIVGMGRISVYEPRGTYQIIMEYAEPRGYGALQIAFEQLKQRLHQEGLFLTEKKKPLPKLPARVGLITSPSGAVIHDLMNIIFGRFSTIEVEIYPVRVQGENAEFEIAKALALANKRKTCDVLILARGGGSLEDLAAFNTEMVARAIFKSTLPIISAIGHETDFTIADFVADVRAPTPTAAAHVVVPHKYDLLSEIEELRYRLLKALEQKASQCKRDFLFLKRSLVHPRKKLQELQLRVDDLNDRISKNVQIILQNRRSELTQYIYTLMRTSPMQTVQTIRSHAEKLELQLHQAFKTNMTEIKDRLAHLQAMLDILNPKALLQKGYSITRTLPQQQVVTSSHTVTNGQPLEILLSKGRLHVIVKNKLTSSED